MKITTSLCLTFAATIINSIVIAVERRGNFYKIEVNFTRFENVGGIVYTGEYCDQLTACDPQLYAYIDVEAPFSPHPGINRLEKDFQLVHRQCCANSYNMTSENQIIKVICQVGENIPLPNTVNVRVKILDKDIFTPNDLIEQFDCVFPFTPTSRSVNIWSDHLTCVAVNKPRDFKLFYRQRTYPIFSTECYVPF